MPRSVRRRTVRGDRPMKTLLVLVQHPELAETIRTAVNPEQYRVVHRATIEEAEPLLAHGLAQACILEAESSNVQGMWLLEKLRRRAPKCPVLIYAETKDWEWEEEAYLQGATHVLAKPVRPRMLIALLDRLWAEKTGAPAEVPVTPPSRQESARPVENAPAAIHALGVLRDFSGILTHSLDAEATLKQFLLLLRQMLGLNRAAIFLRSTAASAVEVLSPPESQRLRIASSIGLSSSLLQHVELSFDTGIGGQLFRSGRILRRSSDEARNDKDAQKEFELLGGQVAVPILDRETMLGVAIFDGRITGEPLANVELELVFHLLEQLGLAIKNSWLHEQLAANHEMMVGILRELNTACVVVNSDLTVLHANKIARKYFGHAERRGGDLEFNDLPHALGAKVYQVLKNGSAVANLKYEPEGSPGALFIVNVVPFQRSRTGLPGSALLMAEDLTQTGQLQRLEIEAANLRLIKTMADRLTHEIGNALVPLSTHQQLLADKWKDAEFRASLDVALADGVKRVSRLISQMRFLARDAMISPEAFPLAPLLDEAFQEARKHQPAKNGQIKYDAGATPAMLTGDRAALKHALAEVILNALQANPADPKIGVRSRSEPGGNGTPSLQIEVQDNGAGFTPEAVQKAVAPFFTTRNVGLGLGLTVSRKIIETHRGKLEILAPKTGHAGLVRISLPLDPSVTALS
jgi:signal transduction histidine kinase/DNA-binding response OmpR family regulator